MLDEPSGGVAQKETEALGPLLLRIVERTGCSVVVIEHDMPLLRSICDEMIALELGGIIAQGPPEEVLEHPAVIESYLGTDDPATNRSRAARPAERRVGQGWVGRCRPGWAPDDYKKKPSTLKQKK